MRGCLRRTLGIFGLLCSGLVLIAAASAADPLPSWNEGAAKTSILNFVAKVTTAGSPDFVPLPERIAVFDNDGTLWCEQPFYFQGYFVISRIQAQAAQHLEWKTLAPFSRILSGDRAAMSGLTQHDLAALIAATHSGMTTDEFGIIVRDWLGSAKHPKYQRPFTELVYQPMLEVLEFLRASGFKTFIVSGGGVDFMRAFAEKTYGIPPEQVIGSSGKLKFELRDNRPVLLKLAEIGSIDDGPGKPVNIELHIGRRPVMAFGNSDGDQQMLEWTTSGSGARFGLIVHHTDAEREYAYDRQSPIGKLDKAWDEAIAKGWTVMDMKQDWKTVFPPAK